MNIATEYTDAASRPSGAEQDRLQSLYRSRRQAKTAVAPKPSYYLANGTQTVTFTPAADGTVTIRAERLNQGFTVQILSLNRARKLYWALKQSGMTPW